jgi:uncharacterized protein (TIGR03086 family)
MEPTVALHRALDQLSAVVDATTADQYGLPTPCEDFDVKTLLNHTVASVRGLADAAAGTTWDMSMYGRDLLGDDPAGSFATAASALREATTGEDVLDRAWAMPSGESPGAQAIAIGILEVTQHAWDLARATGQDVAFDRELSEHALELAQQNLPPDDQRPPAAFGPSVPVDDAAPAHDRLAAFMGRTP